GVHSRRRDRTGGRGGRPQRAFWKARLGCARFRSCGESVSTPALTSAPDLTRAAACRGELPSERHAEREAQSRFTRECRRGAAQAVESLPAGSRTRRELRAVTSSDRYPWPWLGSCRLGIWSHAAAFCRTVRRREAQVEFAPAVPRHACHL